MEEISYKQFPNFFTTNGPIQNTIVPLTISDNIYWMSVVDDGTSNSLQQRYIQPYEDNEGETLHCCDIEENYDILLTKSGKFMTSFYVPSSLLSHIIGPKGIKLKNLQKVTNTLIKVPKLNEKGNVKITGDTERKVSSARTQILMNIMQQKDRLPITHFISIPMVSDNVKERIHFFEKQVMELKPRGVTASIFQKPEKLHLTICALTLVDDEEINSAKKVLQSCYDDISSYFESDKKRILVLQGLEIMNDDPSEVNVLYCNAHMEEFEQNQKLQEVADKISEYYYKAGLARKQYDRVKLHVTIMNTSFRRADEKRETFDATNILSKFQNYNFGCVDIKNIQLSIRFTSGDDKYYDCELAIKI